MENHRALLLVMLVSPDAETVATVAAHLDYNHYNLLITRQEADAIVYLRDNLPDILIFEPATGVAAADLLASFFVKTGIRRPLLLVTTGGGIPENYDFAVDEVLPKPVSAPELSARLDTLAKISRLEEQLQSCPAPVRAVSRTRTVLIVDDSPVQRRVLSRYLQGQNLEIVTAASGEEALEAALRNPPDLVLLDLVLPGMDGFQVCRRLKSSPETADVPVVFITSQGSQEEKILGLECGADDFLVKPVDQRELLVRTGTLLRRKQLLDALVAQASRDPLTGLYNRRTLASDLERELSRARRYRLPVGLIMLDVDFFKQYNDNNGHPAGDEVLRQVASLLTAHTRQADLVCRYGGEEFVVLLPQTDLKGAAAAAEKLRAGVEEHPFPYGESQPGGRLTVSLGVAAYPEHGDTGEELLRAADLALYRAKKSGRNRCALAVREELSE